MVNLSCLKASATPFRMIHSCKTYGYVANLAAIVKWKLWVIGMSQLTHIVRKPRRVVRERIIIWKPSLCSEQIRAYLITFPATLVLVKWLAPHWKFTLCLNYLGIFKRSTCGPSIKRFLCVLKTISVACNSSRHSWASPQQHSVASVGRVSSLCYNYSRTGSSQPWAHINYTVLKNIRQYTEATSVAVKINPTVRVHGHVTAREPKAWH